MILRTVAIALLNENGCPFMLASYNTNFLSGRISELAFSEYVGLDTSFTIGNLYPTLVNYNQPVVNIPQYELRRKIYSGSAWEETCCTPVQKAANF